MSVGAERIGRDARADAKKNGEPKSAYEVCLEVLRADPEADMAPAFEEVQERFGWNGTTLSFSSGPWRQAKMAERKERTGSAWKQETLEKRKREAKEEAARQEAPVKKSFSELLEELREEVEDEEPPVGVQLPFLDISTPSGHLTVRPEGSGFRIIFSGCFDQETSRRLSGIISGVLQEDALGVKG